MRRRRLQGREAVGSPAPHTVYMRVGTCEPGTATGRDLAKAGGLRTS